MKSLFPHGKIWKLLEGKLCKMEGKTRRGVEILRDARRRDNTQLQQQKKNKDENGGGGAPPIAKPVVVCDLAQLQALAVYEMGW